MTKIKIPEYPNKSEPNYSHLHTLVEFLLASGNRSSNDFIWGVNRTGYFCHLVEDIDFKALHSHFDIPESIQVSEIEQRISCMKTYADIKVIKNKQAIKQP